MATRIQLRGDTAANWASNNPTLAAREFAVETDTLRIKVGNGSDAYNTLQYASVPAYNGLDKTVAGFTLDARQGKALEDSINSLLTLPSIGSNEYSFPWLSDNQSGDIYWTKPFNALTSVSAENGPLDARQGKILNDLLTAKAPRSNPEFVGSARVSYSVTPGDENGDTVVEVVNIAGDTDFLINDFGNTFIGKNLLTNGAIVLSTRVSNSGPILSSDSVLFGNTTGSIELPAAASNSGRVLRLICNSASTPYVFNPGQSDSIIKKDGSVITFPSMLEIAAPYGSVTLISDGISKWYSI